MNTFAKAGRIALSHLFTKKELFTTTRYEEMGMVTVFPREVAMSKYPIDLEEEYLGHMVGTLGREKNYKIFFWSVEMGLTEILLVSGENEGKLSDLLCRFAEGTITHIVIAEKYEWDSSSRVEWELRKNKENSNAINQCVIEKVSVYSMTEEQKRYITGRIHNEELDQFESEEEFTFNHGYFSERLVKK
ncbi:MAG TPA: hypothetical protein VMR49_01650 [Candidatus Paceibacterota bacterium]|jgi:hypothetical protein|nr:hypothetical protein [Candidatus Paceibacterota bacterium]